MRTAGSALTPRNARSCCELKRPLTVAGTVGPRMERETRGGGANICARRYAPLAQYCPTGRHPRRHQAPCAGSHLGGASTAKLLWRGRTWAWRSSSHRARKFRICHSRPSLTPARCAAAHTSYAVISREAPARYRNPCQLHSADLPAWLQLRSANPIRADRSPSSDGPADGRGAARRASESARCRRTASPTESDQIVGPFWEIASAYDSHII